MEIRNSIKIILLNSKNELLLICTDDKSIKNSEGKYNGKFWQLVGGKIEEGESYLEAATRELFEETSLTESDVEFGNIVWYGNVDLKALLKTNRYDKMKNMEDKKICPKCGREEKVKNGFNRGKQRYLCKNCGCNYTGTKNGYSEAVKQEAIKYYMEGMGFRRIERLLHVSHVSVINWVKKAAKKIRENECKKETRSDIIELDEMCISFKKTSGYGQQ